eukprot:3919218-Pyramimonas_sp.AAC.1
MHRRCNDVDRGLVRAGVYGNCLLRCFEANIAHGPWISGQYYSEMQDMAMDLVQAMQADDPLLLKLWPMICNDRGWDQPRQVGGAARGAFVKTFATQRPFQT